MSGVEAAASLFGSEESGSDLFATLGTESTSPHQFSEASLTSNDVSVPPDGSEIPFQLDTYTSASSDFSQYPAYSSEGAENAASTFPYDSNTNGEIEQWGRVDEQNYLGTEYSTYTEPANSDYNAYAQPTETTYSPPTNTTMYAPSTATYPVSPTTHTSSTTTISTQAPVHSSYSAYDPPIAPSPYTSYAPKRQAYVSPNTSYSPATTASAFTAPSYDTNHTSQPLIPTPAKTTLNRPKVSNAYDPPFLQTLPSRKPPRSASNGSQYYSQYQSHAPSSYPQTNEVSTFNHYQPPPSIPLATNQNYSSEVPPVPFARATQESEHFYNQNEGPSVASSTTGYAPYTAASSQQYHRDDLDETRAAIEPKTSSGFQYTPEVNHVEHHDSQFPLAEPIVAQSIQQPHERRSIDDPPASSTISPRSIPLPFSPPIHKAEILDNEASMMGNEHSNRSNSSYKPPSQQAPKREFSTSRDTYDPYAPKSNQTSNNYIPRTSSPLSISSGRPNGRKTPVSTSLNPSPYGSIPRPLVGISPATLANVPVDGSRQLSHWSEHKLAPQDIIVKGTAAQYAPSPSLIGANDPLSRTSARAPVVTFGFGGKMVTCFHGMPGQNAGFDVALSSRTTSELKIHVLQKFLPESALNSAGPSYPGPLLGDPGTSSLSLVRPGQTTQVKTKKAGILSYLSGRASELHQGLGYFASAEKQAAEDKLILVKLLSVMVENDGRLLGTPQADSAVRSVLVPRLEGATVLPDGASLQASFNPTIPDEVPVSTITVRPSALDKIEELLLQGNRRQAYQFAMDQKLWAHALIIASSIDKESWKEVVNDFLRTELGSKEDAARIPASGLNQMKPNNRDSLRVAYSLFSGQGAAAIQELAPINLLHTASGRLQPPTNILPALTPRTPNFPVIQSSIPSEALSNWAETAAMIIASPLTPEVSGALTALGDQLLANNWVDAAHSCYLLSSQTSLFGGLGNPSARIVLVGSKNPADPLRDSDTIIFSEILEFAMSLIPIVKGHEPFHGLPHLQAYKFLRAVSLAEIGEIQLANRYCEAIASYLSQASPHTTVALLEQMQGLQQRISGVFHGEKGNSWIGGKISKPSLDTIGGWLEGRFTKLVTGDADEPTPTAENAKATGQPFAGPFAHYSTISSTTPSARSSPQPSFTNLSTLPPQRTTSAMATSTPYSQVQVERASSAMGYIRQKPAIQTSKDTGGSISSSQSSPTGYGLNGHRYDDPYTPKYASNSAPVEDTDTPVQAGSSWWGGSDDNGVTSTPTAATFMPVEESSIQPSGDGFVSLMDNHSYSIGPQPVNPQSGSSSPRTIEEDEDDDLGLGNSKPKPKKEEIEESKDEAQSTPTQAATPASAKPAEVTASNSGSWFGRWWKRSDSTAPGPIKASLGEESAFYYDKELKRWVNKNASPEEASKPAAPPPPPSRAQTASPGRTGPKTQLANGPPARSASAIDLSTEPPTKVPMRIRSNLAPPTESAPSTPTGTRMNTNGAPPPPGRPKSSAAKRNIRNRYVDVFQQETGGTS